MSTRPEQDPAVRAGVRVSTSVLLGLRHAAESLPLRAVRSRALHHGGLISPFKGRGMEFEESRPYQAGDDLRSLDWRVTARTGKPHTKLFREERERPILLWVDLRAAMHFGTRGAFKSVIAARAAAMLAWSALHHGDRLGGLVFAEADHTELRPQRGVRPVLHFIDSLAGHAAWNIAPAERQAAEGSGRDAILRLRRVVRPGSLVFLLTDGRDIVGDAEAQLAAIAAHNDVVLVSIHDPLEAQLPPPGSYRIADARRDGVLDTRGRRLREEFQARFAERERALLSLCRRNRIHYIPCSTDDDTLTVMQSGLGLRPMLRGRRGVA